MGNAFDVMFAPAADVLLDVFGETGGVTRIAAGGAESAIANAILDLTTLAAMDVLDSDGQRVVAHALLTVPTATVIDITNDRIKRGAETWKIVGQTADSGTLTTYALSKTSHAVIRRVTLHKRAN